MQAVNTASGMDAKEDLPGEGSLCLDQSEAIPIPTAVAFPFPMCPVFCQNSYCLLPAPQAAVLLFFLREPCGIADQQQANAQLPVFVSQGRPGTSRGN